MKLLKKTTTTYWKTYEYTTPGTYTLTVPKNTACKLILVGGGGGGSASTSGFPGTWTAAGGSAGMVTGASTVDAGSYTIVVGEHGIGRTRSGGNQTGTDGGDSTAFGNIAGGGGGGKTYLGGMSGSATPGAAGTATATTGFTGTNGVAGSTTSRYGTYGGGGAQGANNGQDGYCKIELALDSSDYDYTEDETVCYAVKEVVERIYWKYTDFVQPVLSANGTMGGDSFACNQSSYLNTNRLAWKAFDEDNQIYDDNWHSANGHPAYIEWYNPNPLKISNIRIRNRDSDGSYIKQYTISYSDNGSNWEQVASGTSPNQTAYGEWDITITELGYHQYWRLTCISSSGSNSGYTAIQHIGLTAQIISSGTAEDYDYYTDVLGYKGVK